MSNKETTIEVKLADAAPVRDILDKTARLVGACHVLRHNPCNCESCLPYKHQLILAAVDDLCAVAGVGRGE